MSVCLIDEDGRISRSAVESLSPDELRQWIRGRRLHGMDPYVSLDPSTQNLPHALIVNIYPDLAPLVREGVQRTVLAFLDELARDDASSWRGTAGDHLLMLVEPVLQSGRVSRRASAKLIGARHSLSVPGWRLPPSLPAGFLAPLASGAMGKRI